MPRVSRWEIAQRGIYLLRSWPIIQLLCQIKEVRPISVIRATSSLAEITSLAPGYGRYQENTDRIMPIIRLKAQEEQR